MIFLLVITFFSLIGMKALFHPGLFTAHDIWHQVVRLYYYNQAISDGQFPPYWIAQLANNFGYPLFLFSYHFPWLLGSAFMKIGLDIQTAMKILFFLSYIGSGITMYFFVSNLLKNKLSALLSAILYLWLPYHFLIIFVSASMGIAFVFTFLPLIFLSLNLIREKSRFGLPLLALGIAGLTLSHIMHLIFIAPITLIFLIWELKISKERIKFLKNIGLGLTLGVLLSSFYLIPATYYNQFTKVGGESGLAELYKRNFINFNQLLYSKWGFSPIVNNAKNGEISFQLGIAQWISILILSLLLIIKKINKDYRGLSLSLLLAFIGSIFLMLDSSKPLWVLVIKVVSIDFPFRFILPATFIASVASGLILISFKKKFSPFLFLFLTVIALYTNRNHINVNQYTNFPTSSYLDLETEKTTNTFNEYLPLKADDKLLNKPWNEIKGENLTVSDTKLTTNHLSFNVSAKSEETVSIGQFYFPGQTLYFDRKITPFNINKNGLISFTIPIGTHTVEINYQETRLIKISKYLTIGGIIIASLLFLTYAAGKGLSSKMFLK